MLSAKISRDYKNSGILNPSIDTSRPSRDPYRSSMSESSLRVILLPSLVYPYFELDIEQDGISKGKGLDLWEEPHG